jgi:hypothetical protein
MTGNWMWGQFFYNVSYAVSEVTGVIMSSKNSYVNVLGYANAKPIIMNLNKADGQILKFLTVDLVDTSSGTTPSYTTYQALFLEEKEYIDDKSYYYVSFVKDDQMHFLKFGASDLKITWHYSLKESGTYAPRYLIMDPVDQTQFYIMGQMNAKGSILRLQRRDAKVNYQVNFNTMTDVTAYT